MIHQPSGHHVLLDLYGIAAERLTDGATLQQLLVDSARAAGAHVLHSHFHSFGPESGITGVVLLAESHISIHTWPESGFAAVDIFMCGQSDAQHCMQLIQKALAAQRHQQRILQRGE